MRNNWLLYGGYGFTGTLIAEEALRRGHRPVLSGRSTQKLKPLSERLGLDFITLGLEDRERLTEVVADFDLVLHAAGPYVNTAAPMVQACLQGNSHYLDISGEVPVLEDIFAHQQEAAHRRVALIPGVGFDVVASDCLARHVAGRLPGATSLEIGVFSPGGFSIGTFKSALEHLDQPFLVRRDGELRPLSPGGEACKLPFPDGERYGIPIAWGDLVTAFHSTGIPNIKVHMVLPTALISLLQRGGMSLPRLLAWPPIRRLARWWADHRLTGPDARTRQNLRAYIWARVSNGEGSQVQGWLQTMQSYRFTALASVRCVEKLLVNPLRGVLTPSQAFGADFVLELPDTRRVERLWDLRSHRGH